MKMDCEAITERTMDSIDVTIFEDFHCLDITMPFTSEPVKTAQPIIPLEPLPKESADETSPKMLKLTLESQKELSCGPSPTQELSYSHCEAATSLPPVDLPETGAELSEKSFSKNFSKMQESALDETLENFPEVFSTSLVDSLSSRKSPPLHSKLSPGLSKTPMLPPKRIPKSQSKSSLKPITKASQSMSSLKPSPQQSSKSPCVPHSIFTPHCSVQKTKSSINHASCKERVGDEPWILFSPFVSQTAQNSNMNRTYSTPNFASAMKENKVPNRAESPTDMDKTLVLKQISASTNQSPIYTPFTKLITHFKHLSLESPFVPANKDRVKSKRESPIKPRQPNSQHQTRVEKVKLISPLLRSPKLKQISAKYPLRSNSKVTNSVDKKSPTLSQYKARTPVIQGSRIPVLKLDR